MKKLQLALPIVFSAALAASTLCAENGAAALIDELERLSDYIVPDYFDGEYTFEHPSPKSLETKYNLTREEILDALKAIALKYDAEETDKKRMSARTFAISHIGGYGSTNDVAFLGPIVRNPKDYAQQSAIGASMRLLTGTDDLLPFVHSVATNCTSFSWGLRIWTEGCLLMKCDKDDKQSYIDDPALHAKIAAYFIERAGEEGVEFSDSLTSDRRACELNPWYRHSQLRRDNLAKARARAQNLTEAAKEVFDARQRDAAADGGE